MTVKWYYRWVRATGEIDKVAFSTTNARELGGILLPDGGLTKGEALELVNKWNRLSMSFNHHPPAYVYWVEV